MSRIIFLFVCFINFWPPLGRAEGTSPLTLRDVLTSVKEQFPSFRATLQDKKKAEAQLLSNQGGFDPLLRSTYGFVPSGKYARQFVDLELSQFTGLWGSRVFVGYLQSSGDFSSYDQHLVASGGGDVRFGVEMPLLRGGFLDTRVIQIDISKKGVEISEASVLVQLLESGRQASYRYVEWVTAGERLKLARHLLKLSVDRDEGLKLRVKKGDVARIEQIDNQRTVVQREAALIGANRALEKAALELSIYYRNANGDPIIATVDNLPRNGLEEPSIASPVQNHSRPAAELALRHPEVRRLEIRKNQNMMDVSLAQNSILPILNAEISAVQPARPQLGSNPETEYKAGLKLDFPLLMRTGRGRAAGAIADGLRISLETDLMKDRIRTSILDTKLAMTAASERYLKAQSERQLAAQVEEAERIRLKQGESNILTVNLREQITAEAVLRALDNIADFHRAQADLEALVGVD